MAEKRILVLDADVLKKLDENRGDISRAEFIRVLIDSHLEEESTGKEIKNYVNREEFEQFAQGIKDLLRNFLEFFISYGLELDKQPKDHTLEELTSKLQALENKARKS